jgi:predicted enzyme related to lactoylglutathione lyase
MDVLGNMLSWIVVKDLDKAIEFYTDVVGLTLKVRSKEYGWAELSDPKGGRLGLAQESDQMANKAGSNAVITIAVKDLNAAIAFFQKQKVHLQGDVETVPGHVKTQTFLDADGNMMQLVEMLDS